MANYSSYMKLLHFTGWVIKFIEKLKSLKNPNYTYKAYITISNINEAKVLWIRDVQKKGCQQTLKILRNLENKHET